MIELLIVVAIILIISAIAIPNLLRARMNANDSAAAFTMRTLNTAETTYITNYPAAGYAPSLITLGPNTNCFGTTASSTNACLIDNLLGCTPEPCVKTGYKFWLTSSSGAAPYPDYTASATPLSMSTTGRHNLCSNADDVVKVSPDGSSVLSGPVSASTCAAVASFSALDN